MNLRLKTRERRLLVITIFLSCALLIYGRYVEPRLSRWHIITTQLRAVENDLASTQDLLDHRSHIEANSSALQKQIAAQGNDDQEQKSMLQELEQLVLGAHLSPISMRPHKSKDLGFYQLMSVDLMMEGDQRNLVRFLYDIGQSTQLLRIDRLHVSALRSGEKVRAQCLVIKILSSRGRP